MNEIREEEGISLLDILLKVKKHILFIIISIVSCIGVMGVYSTVIQKPVYIAKSSLLMNSELDGIQAINYSNMIISTFQDYIVEYPEVRERALEIAGLDEKTEYTITTNNQEGKLIIEIVITSKDKETSEKLAEAYALASIEIVSNNPDGDLKILGKAEPGILKKTTSATKSTNLVKNCIIGAAGGVVIACAYIFIRLLIENTFTKPEEIEKELGVPVLAVTPYIDFEVLKENGTGGKKPRK